MSCEAHAPRGGGRAALRAGRVLPHGALRKRQPVGKISMTSIFFAIFWRARSRLYQNEILQVNSTKYAFDSIFRSLQDVHTFAPLQ